MKYTRILFVWCGMGVAVCAGCAGTQNKENGMKVGDCVHGFKVISITQLPEVSGRLWRMSYEKNGADLAWLERSEDNKTFAIGFKTLPSDDTGVAHILEHSVLCGSEKYPSKEPFVDLLKGSLATFLNAMTYPDKTVYPVASRNDRDFLNLMDVYLDAVLHPLSIKDPHALAQEGWHYEIESPTGPLTRNGVVYSEMKGVFANPDSVVFRETMHALFPSNTYGFESGGDPESIPDLTFEKYCQFHARFYHPSNARIFLDGQVDIEAALTKLDEFLSPYERIMPNTDIPMQMPVVTNAVREYEVGPDEPVENKTIVADGFVCGTYRDRVRIVALNVLTDVLTGSNESPLKKALLDAGLCEDVEIGTEILQQPIALIMLRNVPDGKAQAARKCLYAVLEKCAREGLDRKQLDATINHFEFSIREKDSGSMPRGLAFMDAAFEGWLYGGDPAQAFQFQELFATLRAGVRTGLFEKYLRETFLENTHRSQFDFTPSRTLGSTRRAREEKRMAALKASWSEDEIKSRIRACATLKARQRAADKAEDLARLPRLARSDMPRRGPEIEISTTQADGVTFIRPKTGADGIVYWECYFPLASLDYDDLVAAPFLALCLGELATANYDALALKSEIDGNLGRFSVNVSASKKGPYCVLKTSALSSKCEDAVRLALEVLLTTKFTDTKAVGDLLKQSREDLERSFSSGGHRHAMLRAGAGFSEENYLGDLFGGVGQLRWLQEADKAYRQDPKPLLAKLTAMKKRLFTRVGLVTCASDNLSEEWLRTACAKFPQGDRVARMPPFKVKAPQREGFVIPGDVGFVGVASKMSESDFSGTAVVASRILTLDWLWNQIRVLGGAYGMGLVTRKNGDVQYMTYRDPNPKRSFEKIGQSPEQLVKAVRGGVDLDKYIVSAIGKTEPYLTPRLETSRAADLYFANYTPDDVQKLRAEILDCDATKLEAFAAKLEGLRACESRCLIGGKGVVEACSNLLDRVESVR